MVDTPCWTIEQWQLNLRLTAPGSSGPFNFDTQNFLGRFDFLD